MNTIFNYLFVSDLHLSEGCDPQTGLLHRNEDFFHDLAFAQFVAHHVHLSREPGAVEYYQKPWKLVINGDIFDFLQVVSLPPDEDGVITLDVVDDQGNPMQVQKTLSKNEKRYGLGTTSAETVWKLNKIAAGHPLFFQALAWFVAHPGNELVLMKGNHDIEIVWPAVHKRLCRLLAAAYETWQQQAAQGDVDSPLMDEEGLPERVTAVQIESSLHFPVFYLYEEGLFYAEHGCQYDPVNSFSNFADPRLQKHPDYIELPEGSLFVRYFFNDVEQIHPFADNMKPISKYIFWLVRNSPSSLFQFLWDLLPKYLRAIGRVKEKTRHHPKGNQQPPQNKFEQKLFEIQGNVRDGMAAGSKKTTRRMVASVLFVVVSIILGLVGVRLLASGSYLWMAAAFVGALLFVFWSSFLFQSLDVLLAQPFLYKGAMQISDYLNTAEQTLLSPVPYFIFGHDHAADVRLIRTKNRADFRQWYVNTGAWVPVFNEEERLLRDDVQLTFLRLVPDRMTGEGRAADRDTPQLLQWSPEANAPRPMRLFE